jgi:hypothetical protein
VFDATSNDESTPSCGGLLLQEENWAPALKEFLLPGAADPTVVPVGLPAGVALLRWQEEAKMYANIEAQTRGVDVQTLLDDPAFLDTQDARANTEWPASKVRSEWRRALDNLTERLEDAVRVAGEHGAFIKLSVSPTALEIKDFLLLPCVSFAN